MRVFAHPLRLDNAGAVATIEQGSLIQSQRDRDRGFRVLRGCLRG